MHKKGIGSKSMKTISQIAQATGVHRTTLNKAIQRGDIPATRYGNTFVIDEESAAFKTWLAGTGKGRPRNKQSIQSSQVAQG